MTIGEVSEKYDISIETLRYYERIGLIPKVHRNTNGIRNYNETDCNWVKYIKCMRGAGVSIESLIEYVTLFKQGDSTVLARKQILIEQRAEIANKIENMQIALQRLDTKIDGYEDKVMDYEKKLVPKN